VGVRDLSLFSFIVLELPGKNWIQFAVVDKSSALHRIHLGLGKEKTMQCKTFILTSFFFSWIFFPQFSPLAYANVCPNSTPQDSQVWRDFAKVLQTEYFDKRMSGTVDGPDEADTEIPKDLVNSAIVGHALGRLALAVQDQPDRRAAFDCVQLAIEQRIALGNLWGARDRARIFRILMQGSYGMHDEELGRYLKGGLPMGPLYDVLGGKIHHPSHGAGSGGVGGGTVSQDTKTPMIIKKDPAAVGGGFPLRDSTGGGNVAAGSSSEGHCSNWMRMSFSDSTGTLHPGDTEKACTLTGESGDFITRIHPTTKACSICSREDWTPPVPPVVTSDHGGGSGGTADGGKDVADGGVSGERKCHLYSGYLFSNKAGTEFNVLQEKNSDKNGYTELLYTVGTISKRFNHIETARKDAERIVKEGTRGKQYGFAFRGGLDGFCNYIESQCDIENSSVKVAEKACKWSK